MKVIVFEDEGWRAFAAVALLKHTSQLKRGTKSLLDALVEKVPGATEVGLWGRPELAAYTRESTRMEFNEKAYGSAFFVNARAKPTDELVSLAAKSSPFVALCDGMLVAARIASGNAKPGVVAQADVVRLSRRSERLEAAPGSLFAGYWDLVSTNGLAIAEQARHFADTQALTSSIEVRGAPSNLRVEGGAEVEGHVTFDARLGPIVVEKGASIESFSRVMGPCFIGARTKLFSAQIGGGTSIFESCKVGGQVEDSIIMPHSNKAHLGYVGDSYVGEWVNLGAGSNFSNLKNTYGNVRLSLEGRRVDTGMLKLGPMVGDLAKLSIGALVYAGVSVGTASQVSGLASSNVPPFTYVNGTSGRQVELLLDSAVETQRRMMDRRGAVLSRALEGLIRKAFASTAKERRKAGVKKGNLA